MKHFNNTGKISATILFALGCGITFIPAFMGLSVFVGPYAAFRLTLWIFLAVFSLLLCRWSKTSIISCAFPLILLLVLVFAGLPKATFLLAAIVVLAWIRSGICFTKPVVKAVFAEIALTLGGAVLVDMLTPHSVATWALAIWLFFLIQSLYFVLTPGERVLENDPKPDAFEQAKQKARRILSGDI